MIPPFEELFEGSLGLDSPEKTIQQLPPCRGIFLIVDNNKCPIQLLSAANLRRAVLVKLAEPIIEEPTRKTDLRSIASFLYWTQVGSEFHCTWLYNRMVHLLFHEQADDLICLPAAHCVRICLDEAWASFSPAIYSCQDRTAVFYGPFSTRKTADTFAHLFNTVFALCRNRPLALSGEGRKCSYFQMGLCPGPCLKKGEEIQYRQTVRQAIEAASGSIQSLQEQLAVQMKICADQMRFERAQMLKDQLAQLVKLKGSLYRWTCRLDRLQILHIAQGPGFYSAVNLRRKIPIYLPYLIGPSEARKLPNFSPGSIGAFLNILEDPSLSRPMVSQSPAEHLALTSLYLYKSRPPGLWIDLNAQPGLDETGLREALAGCFEKNGPAEDE